MKVPQLQFDNFGLRHLPRLSPVRQHLGLRWRSCFPPASWAITTLVGVAVALIVVLLMGVLATSDESALAAAQARHAEAAALLSLGLTEQHLIHLMNGGTLMVDTDFLSCRLRDRASTKL